LEDLQAFRSKNEDWLAAVNAKIMAYLAGFSEEDHDNILIDLRGDKSRTCAVSDYFS